MNRPDGLRSAITSATAVLADAGIDSARHDAEALAAHLSGTDRGRLSLLEPPGDEFFERYRDVVAKRARRVPLQHITGKADFGPVTLRVGPGCSSRARKPKHFWNGLLVQQLPARPLIVDLCTGSGALALALARRFPAARVLAVDDSETALQYARTNRSGSTVELLSADVTTPGLLPELDDRVDLVVANPPYVPDGAALDPEVADHDPQHAVFGGPDGMRVIAAVAALAGRWLRPGGLFAVEHDDTTSSKTVEMLLDTGRFDNVAARRDLTGRLRFVTAGKVRSGAFA